MQTPDPRIVVPPPPAPEAPKRDVVSPDGSSEGNLDLDDEDGINNQHLEVR